MKTLDIENSYTRNFMRSKMLQGNRLTQELQENNIEDDIIEVTEIVEEKDSKIRSGKADKKNKKTKIFYGKLGEDVGLLFQLADDFLDIKGSKKLVGKPIKKDKKKGK